MPRPRNATNRRLAPNLYAHGKGFRYIDPMTKKKILLRYDSGDLMTLVDALAVALKVNAARATATTTAERIITGAIGYSITETITKFYELDVPALAWSKRYAYDQSLMVERIKSARIVDGSPVTVGEMPVGGFMLRDATKLLETVAPGSATSQWKFRKLLSSILRRAVAQGWAQEDVTAKMVMHRAERKRARLTYEAFLAIRDHAATPKFLRDAMDVGLWTLLRREDIAGLKFADLDGDMLHVVPSKTAESSGVRLRYTIGPELRVILTRCRDNVASPFIVHRLPGRITSADKRCAKREHHTQVFGEVLGDAFAAAREATGLFAGMENPPTFHEIRSLGIARYCEMGIDVKDVQKVAAHGSQAMTEKYRKGHAKPWQDVATG